MKQNWKAYYRGIRMFRRMKGRFNYTMNPFKYQSAEWYCFNQGWNTNLGYRGIRD